PIFGHLDAVGPLPQSQVAEDDIGVELVDDRQRSLSAVGLADDGDVLGGVDDRPQTGPHDRMVIDEDHSNAHGLSPGSVSLCSLPPTLPIPPSPRRPALSASVLCADAPTPPPRVRSWDWPGRVAQSAQPEP